MKVSINKVVVEKDTEKTIRKMFFQQIEMRYICKKVNLSERIIRRVINEHQWIQKRERYLRFLCSFAYLHKISLYKMADVAGVNRYSLGRIHRKFKTQKPPRESPWNKKINQKIESDFIKEYNEGNASQSIAEKYGFKTKKTVLDVLIKNKIQRRPCQKQTYYDKSFFEKINSSKKAYILGLIMADGYIIKDYSGFGIQLTKTDGYLLKQIASIIGARQGVTQIVCDTKRRALPNARDMVRLAVYNRKMAKDLMTLGVTRRKSKTIRYNGCVPKKYLSHFFRGLIDGDGTIGIAKNKNIWCQLVSASKGFIDDLLNVKLPFVLRLNKSVAKYYSKKYDAVKISRMYVARVSGGNKETIRFLKWLYGDKNELYLRRKYEKVQDKVN